MIFFFCCVYILLLLFCTLRNLSIIRFDFEGNPPTHSILNAAWFLYRVQSQAIPIVEVLIIKYSVFFPRTYLINMKIQKKKVTKKTILDRPNNVYTCRDLTFRTSWNHLFKIASKKKKIHVRNTNEVGYTFQYHSTKYSNTKSNWFLKIKYNFIVNNLRINFCDTFRPKIAFKWKNH